MYTYSGWCFGTMEFGKTFPSYWEWTNHPNWSEVHDFSEGLTSSDLPHPQLDDGLEHLEFLLMFGCYGSMEK